jgi:hypothetical protein
MGALRIGLGLACAAALVAGCESSGSTVLVEVSSADPLAATQLVATASLAGMTRGPISVPLAQPGFPPTHSFAIQVTPELSGVMTVHVDAVDGTGAILASGDGSATVTPGQEVGLPIELGGVAVDGGVDSAVDAAVDASGDGPDLAGSCMKHSDCATLVCQPNHQCAVASDVAYVDNLGMTPASCIASGVHDGNQATPFCSIPPALDSGRSYVRVAGSTAHYASLAASSNTWNGRIVIGPGSTAATPATIFADGTAGADAFSTSISMLTFDGMDFSGQLDCLAAGTVQLIDVTIHDSIADGVYVGGCVLSMTGGSIQRTAYSGVRTNTSSASATLVDVTFKQTATSTVFSAAEPTPAAVVLAGGGMITVDRAYIGPGNGVGLLLGGGTYSVTNSFIVDNVGSFAVIGQGATGVFQFNTVANNKRGVNCNNNVIEASIFYNNTVGGSEFNSQVSCTFLNGTVTSASAVQPVFVGTTDYRLNPTSAVNGTCCIDQVHATVDGGAAQLPDHDYFQDHRPQGGGWDVGAHEAR